MFALIYHYPFTSFAVGVILGITYGVGLTLFTVWLTH